tara:strand:- start:603 stop:1394 length:792 start_codon:yes stop_codon:yes gene_type:complete
MLDDIKHDAQGRWQHIHSNLGIDIHYLRNRHMPCPGCGGHDRFRYDDKGGRGTFYCGGGGDPVHGDGFELLNHVHGWDFKTAANQVRRVLGIAPGKRNSIPSRSVHPPESKISKTQPYAEELWSAADSDDSRVTDHPYCVRKGIEWACGAGRGRASGRLVGQGADCVIVPQRTLQKALTGVECINSEGIKQSFGKKGVLVLGNTLDKSLPIYIVEGWADGVATWNYFGNVVVVVVFGIGRQDKLAEVLHQSRPERDIVVVRDA